MSSASPSLNPDLFPTPEAAAKVLYDHEASVVDGRVVVLHKTLEKEFPIKDTVAGQALETAVLDTDWATVAAKTKSEAPSEGGTEYQLTITRSDGSDTIELLTTNIDAYPELVRILATLRSAAGVP